MCTENQLNYILKKVAQTAKETFGEKFDSAYLYGSYARGDFDSESDIDIMVLADIPKEELCKYKKVFTHLTSELGLEYDMLITVSLKDIYTFNKYFNAVPFYQNIKREGVLIAV